MHADEIISGISDRWGDTPAVQLCRRLIDRLSKFRSGGAMSLSYGNILEIAGQDEVSQDLQIALMILTTSEFAIFESGAYFIDEFEESHELSKEEIDGVLRDNVLVHPRSGEIIEDASYHIAPFFIVNKEIE